MPSRLRAVFSAADSTPFGNLVLGTQPRRFSGGMYMTEEEETKEEEEKEEEE